MTRQADLMEYVFEGQPHGLADALQGWLEASARFTAFVDTYRDKVRKKVRLTREPESVLDLRAELAVAYGLLCDRRLAVAYEPYASAKRRGPDFAVTYRDNLVFNAEVARIRVEASAVNGLDLARKEERLVRIVLGKLGQMQPGQANLLVIHTRADLAAAVDLGRLMQAIKTRAERKEPAFYAASGYADPAAFYKHFQRLSGMVLWAAGAPPWVNKQAHPGLEERVVRLVSSLPAGVALPP